MTHYMIVDGDSNELADGVSEQEVRRAAQRIANRLGKPVYAHASDAEEGADPIAYEPSTPTVILTAYNMGPNFTEADYDLWIAYVSTRIDARCGFTVNVEASNFTSGRVSDVVTGATDEQRETIQEALRALWEQGCAENFSVGAASVEKLDEIRSEGLRAEAAGSLDSGGYEHVVINPEAGDASIEVVFLPGSNRVGYATNGDPAWDDAETLEEALEIARGGCEVAS